MKWLFLTLTIITIIIIIPPVIYDYIYPSWGGDSAEHLIYFNHMDTKSPIYTGQYIVGKILKVLPFDINISFMWFNYIIYIVMFWVIGLSVAYAVNYKAAILSVILVGFGNMAAMGLFLGGTIFDLIGIGLLFPLVLLCLNKIHKNNMWIIPSIILLVLFSIWHENGKYIIAFAPIFALYGAIRNKVSEKLSGALKDIWDNQFTVLLAGTIIAILIGFGIDIAKPNSVRLYTDARLLAMILIPAIIITLPFYKKKIVQYAFIIIAIVISIPNLILWFQDFNVIKKADKEAFTYLNELPQSNVLCLVSQDIYELYVKQEFNEEKEAEYIVVRSIPMAFREGYSDEDIEFVDSLNRNGYTLKLGIDYGEQEYITKDRITIAIYKKE